MSTVDMLLRRLEKIQKGLGDDTESMKFDNNTFDSLKFEIEERMHLIECIQDDQNHALESSNQDSLEVLRLKYKILTLIKETDQRLFDLYKLIKTESQHSKPCSSSVIKAKLRKYGLLVKRLDGIKFSENQEVLKASNEHSFHITIEMSEESLILIEEDKEKEVNQQEFEEQMISSWEKMESKIREYAERIGENRFELKHRAELINSEPQKIEDSFQSSATDKEFETSTMRLKKILKVRSGSLFCFTFCLLIILLGLLLK